jgi:hypothetical protein
MPMQHYDWGLRALKTVLGFGGKLIKQSRQNGKTITREMEAEFLVQSLRMNTLSKLAFEDVKRFNGLVGDVFQGVGTPEFIHKELEEAIEAVMAEKKLKVSKHQVRDAPLFRACILTRLFLTNFLPFQYFLHRWARLFNSTRFCNREWESSLLVRRDQEKRQYGNYFAVH